MEAQNGERENHFFFIIACLENRFVQLKVLLRLTEP